MASPCASQASALTPAFTRYKSSAAEPRSQQMTSLTATAFAMMMILITTTVTLTSGSIRTRQDLRLPRLRVILGPGSLGFTPAPLSDDARLDSAVRSVEDAVVHPPEGGSTGSSPSAASDTPPNITPPIAVNAAPPITVNAAPEAVARPLWTAPAAWRPAGRYVRTRSSPILGRGSHSEVVRVVDVLGGHVRARKRVAFVQAPPRSLWFEIEALTRLARHKGIAELIDVCYTAHKVDLIMPLYWGSLQELFDQADGRGLVTSLAKNLS
ncbi:hypothetical protein A4X09_0g7303, partial [Tilletia walkeri]